MVARTFARAEADRVSFSTRKTSARTKVQLLVHGVQDDPVLFDQLSPFKEEHYAYDNGNWGVERGRLIPSEVLLPGGIVAKLHVRPGSPLRLRSDGTSLVIESHGRVLSEATLLPRPRFWEYGTSTGLPTKRLAHFYGATCLNFNIYSGCEFFGAGKPCRFCSVQPTQQQHEAVEIKKRPQDLAETCRLATEHDRVEWFLATGGSYRDGDQEFDAHTAVLEAVRTELPWGGRLRGNVALMPPRKLERLDRLHELGVDHPSFNLEVWPRAAFEAVCPGKAEFVGFDHILKAYERLVGLYGPGKLWCNFVAGLVPLRDQMEGFTFMAERGVIPGANVYHPDVRSRLGTSVPSPNEDYIVALYHHAADLYRRIHVICDNACFHDCQAVWDYLERWGERIVLHFLPKYAPETNPIERVWWHLHETITRNHRCHSIDDLLEEVFAWVEVQKVFAVETAVYAQAA
jgi:transposase